MKQKTDRSFAFLGAIFTVFALTLAISVGAAQPVKNQDKGQINDKILAQEQQGQGQSGKGVDQLNSRGIEQGTNNNIDNNAGGDSVGANNREAGNENINNGNAMSAGNENSNNGNATSSDNGQDKNPSDNQGQITAAEHRGAVATFVQGLLDVANREPGGIGEQVRVVARAQNDSKDQVAAAVDAVQNRSAIKTFLIGSDYKNLGALRSEMAKTQNQLDQLNRLLPNVASDTDKAELQNQIAALQAQQLKIDNFVKTNESKFSLFGWFVKLFNK